MCVCAYVRMCVCAYVRMCVCAYVRMCVCAYVRMCVCAYVRMCICRYRPVQIHKQAHARVCRDGRMHMCVLISSSRMCLICNVVQHDRMDSCVGATQNGISHNQPGRQGK